MIEKLLTITGSRRFNGVARGGGGAKVAVAPGGTFSLERHLGFNPIQVLHSCM